MLWGKCKTLFQNEAISRFWVYNGQLNILMKPDKDGKESRKKITHLDDLHEIFGKSFPSLFQ